MCCLRPVHCNRYCKIITVTIGIDCCLYLPDYYQLLLLFVYSLSSVTTSQSPLTSAPGQVETRLQHPTRYHMLQSQRRQVREYLSHSAEESPPAAAPSELAQVLSPLSNQTSTASEATSEATEVSTSPPPPSPSEPAQVLSPLSNQTSTAS